MGKKFFILMFTAILISISTGKGISQNRHPSPLLQFHHDEKDEQIVLGYTPCINGTAGGYPCSNIDLYAHLPLSSFNASSGNDIWGWTDPGSGRSFALMGVNNGTVFVEITTPDAPVYLGKLPTHTVSSSWRDIKVFDHYAFIVSEANNHGMQIFDLNELLTVTNPPVTFTETAHYNAQGLGSAHNIAINEATGFAYIVGSNTCSGGLHMVNIQTPLSPVFAGCFSDDGYTHDVQCVVYQGPDVNFQGKEICFAANEDTITIIDVTDKSNPVLISRTSYPEFGYTHQGWLTEDHHYFLLNDETDETTYGHNTRTRIFDVSDLTSPSLIGYSDGSIPSIDHNLYIKGSYVYESNYTGGLRVYSLDSVNRAQLTEIAFFDIHPIDDDPVYEGAWSVFPFFSNNIVVVSGIGEGLFILGVNFPPQALLSSTQFSDSCPAGGSGDQDGVLDPGETVTLTADVLNPGNQTLTGLTGTLTAFTPAITIIDNGGIWPDIPPVSTGSQIDTFSFNIDPSTGCGTAIPLKIQFTYDQGSNNESFNLETGSLLSSYLIQEGFDTGIPSDWTIENGGTCPATWSWFEPSTYACSGRPLLDGPAVIADSDCAGTSCGIMDESLLTPVFSTVGCSKVHLAFLHNFKSYTGAGFENADVDVSADGGTSWNTVFHLDESLGSSSGDISLDMTSEIGGTTQARIRFRYYGANYDWWWSIDSVRVECLVYTCTPCNTSPVPDITASPNPVQFDIVQVGQSATQLVSVTNTGSTTLSITSVTPPQPPFTILSDSCTGQSIPPAGFCILTVQFTPDQSGLLSDTIIVHSNDPDMPQYGINLQGTGEYVPDISITPMSIDFGKIETNTSSSQFLTIQNDGQAVLILSSIDPPGFPFSINSDTCSGSSLPPGNSCTLEIVFAPLSENSFSSSVIIYSNDPDTPAVEVPLTGRAQTLLLKGIDLTILDGSGNSIIEEGETFELRPVWENISTQAGANLPAGTLSSSDPVVVSDVKASYKTILPGQQSSCVDTGDCYEITATGPRPERHWDVRLEEALDAPLLHPQHRSVFRQDWIVHIGPSFDDIPVTSPVYPYVETIFHHGMTSGCSDTSYCPKKGVTRGQMAVYIARLLQALGILTVTPCSNTTPSPFVDIPITHPACGHIRTLFIAGIVQGCGNQMYCPTQPVTRGQMAVYIVRAMITAGIIPAPEICVQPAFADVPITHPACDDILTLKTLNIVVGCGNGNYCPTQPVTRGQMAIYLVKAFALQPYSIP